MANSYAHGLGLGLGLPSSFTSAGRTFSSKTIVAPNQTTFDFEGDCFYPLPSQSRRVTLQQEEVCQSYWSPDCAEMDDLESEHSFSQDEEASPAGSSYLGTPADAADGLSPLQLAAHTCLHLLSPEGAMGPVEDALANVREWAWLVPAIDASIVKQPEQSLAAIKEPLPVEAPTMMSLGSVSSALSSVSLRTQSSLSDDEVDAISMVRSHSLVSAFSSTSLSTAATSAGASSVMARKRPIASGTVSKSGQVIKLRGSRSLLDLKAASMNASPESKKPELEKRASVRSLAASVEISTPTSVEWEVMLQPMDKLPSPASTFAPSCSSVSESGASSASDTRATLLDIWAAAEEADRSRNAASSAETFEGAAKRASKWVRRMTKSKSTASLLRRMKEEELVSPIAEADPVSWAASAGPTSKFEELFEPRQDQLRQLGRRRSIDIVLMQAMQDQARAAVPAQRRSNDAVWAFLG